MLKTRLALIAGLAGLALSAPAGAQQSPGSTVKATHGAWQILCSDQRPESCAMVQTGNNDKGEPVVRSLIRKTPGLTGPQGQPVAAVMEVIAPIGVFLPAGVGIKIDGREIGRGVYRVCNPQACLMSEPVQDEFVSQMKAGNNAIITLTRPDGQTTDVTISLSGFTAAFNGL